MSKGQIGQLPLSNWGGSEVIFLRAGIKMSVDARWMDDKVMVIANKNTTKGGIKTKLVRWQGVKRNRWRGR
jgi:hypothetical protein